jgi:uncharacterized membrane protein
MPATARRLIRHLLVDHASARRLFARSALDAIEHAIADGEARHRGQVCVAIEASLPLARVLAKLGPRERALEVFGLARVWDTEENCGVLLYVLLADRAVEIVADRGIHAKVGDDAWNAICRTMERAFAERRFGDGLSAGVAAVNALLEQHFPSEGRPSANELANRPLLL